MVKIKPAINDIDFEYIYKLDNFDDKWSPFSRAILGFIDYVSPIKNVKLKDKEDQTPWIDLKLAILKNKRDKFYSLWKTNEKIDILSENIRK